jgi:histidinol-phosphatase (PHP family)
MKCSLHVHSNYSDGVATIPEIVKFATKLQIDELGISDHFHLPHNGVNFEGDMTSEDLKRYVSEVLSFSNNIKPKVRLGLEVDFVPETLSKVREIIAAFPFDYIIGSIHIIDGKWRLDVKKKNWPDNFSLPLMKKYWLLVRQMAESGIFDIVGHLDVFKKFGHFPKVTLSDEIDEALKAIAAQGMVVELNTSGWYYPCMEQYPSETILQKCVNLKIPLTITADAHRVEDLDRSFERGYNLFRKLGINKLAYFIKRELLFTPLPINIE